MSETQELLLEIGVEELPASFVEAALAALPELAKKRLSALRLRHGNVRALGTPRRLALQVEALATRQPDVDEEVLGPPISAGLDKEGKPTRAAEAFARKLGVEVAALRTVDTPKGKYLAGNKKETGRPAAELLHEVLAGLCAEIPFRKSMRWGDGEQAFGRPVRWLVALYGNDVIPFTFGGITSGRTTQGHRFLSPAAIELSSPAGYAEKLAAAHVSVDPAARAGRMVERLRAKATELGGTLIEDEFLVGENLSLVEEPQIVAGSFETRFLALPEEVILEVAKGHQRYFGVRGPDGKLMPRYLAVVNTALAPDIIVRGNDRVMRARLSDAQFFFDEDKKQKLEARYPKLEGIVFHHRLGSVGSKVKRIVRLTRLLSEALDLSAETRTVSIRAAELAKCDLVALMVGEFPELQGVMGRAYALAQGEPPAVADAIRDHYAPKGAHDATAPSAEAAVVALADRLDTLVGCFAVGLAPTGAADPYALRRACLGVLRTLLDRGWDLSIDALVKMAHGGLVEQTIKLDLDEAALRAKLGDFCRERLRNLLESELPSDVVDACLAVAADRPDDARARAQALATLDAETRAKVGEVFKRVANIAKDAPPGDPVPPAERESAPHAAETQLFEAHRELGKSLGDAATSGDYPRAFSTIASFAPKLSDYFLAVFVMTDDVPLRENRLRLLRAVRDACSTIAHFQLLQGG
jgi:glycyl-tRNA synthetase beta chain